VKGGGPSEEFQELERKAAASEEWRTKALALEHEHTSRDIHQDPPTPHDPNNPPAHVDDVEYFL
jgi:hypothetical protein